MPIVLPSQLERLEDHEIPKEFDPVAIEEFVSETRRSSGGELANAQTIFNGLCRVLRVPLPPLKRAHDDNPYCFEEDVKTNSRAHRRIDVYNRGHFVFEAKQGVDPKAPADAIARGRDRAGHSRTVRGAGVRGTPDWQEAMRDGQVQACRYAVHVMERKDPKPPFVIVADVGHCFWVWSSFSSDPRDDYGDFEPGGAFAWADLARPEVFHFLRQIWLDPQSLNEEARGQRITANIASHITDLALRLEKRFPPEAVGDFLMKCVFTMFAEDVEFLGGRLFTLRLTQWIADYKAGHKDRFVRGLRALWGHMQKGADLDTGDRIRHFNGFLFRDPTPLDLEIDELEALLKSAKADWRRVSPAIFGTLLERALSADERKKLGAFYTPEAYIRRLVEKTIMAPLRDEWMIARAECEQILRTSKTGRTSKKAREQAIAKLHAFRHRLAAVNVLDPACGSGNFLYVALKEMKRLEGEVHRALIAAGDQQVWLDIPKETVHPAQFYGIEVKPWAAKIAELVLWIGYLQWQVSSGRMTQTPEPLLQDLRHIENRDALITWKSEEPVLDAQGQPQMVAQGVSKKRSERSMVPLTKLSGVQVADWPVVEFVVGNPPFLGNKLMSDVLRPAYVAAIREAFPDVPGSADLVMYWWARCADFIRLGRLRRFGLVTTNSITGKFNRQVVANALEQKGIRLSYAIADHPWYDEGAAVRIAMTVGTVHSSPDSSTVGIVQDETRTGAHELEHIQIVEKAAPQIHADLTAGARMASARPLHSNQGVCFQGITLVGEGFRLDEGQIEKLGVTKSSPVLKRYIIGRDLVQKEERRWVIDFHGLSLDEARSQYPTLLEHVIREVKPQRDAQNDRQRREKWWLFGRSGADLRGALKDVPRFIATSRTAKHRLFSFLSATTLPDTKVVAIAVDDSSLLAVLSSRVHEAWAMRAGGWLGVGNDSTYNHVECFGQFPFPELDAQGRLKLTRLGEALDAHRKARQQAHPELALTDMYNVLAKLRAGQALNAAEQQIRDQGLIDTLRQLHDDIDRATLAAYGWPEGLTDDALIARLLDLNAERVAEEATGHIRWLRPDFQTQTVQAEIAKPTTAASSPDTQPKAAKVWPAELPDRIRALVQVLQFHGRAVPVAEIQAAFPSAKPADLELVLHCAAAADAVVRTEDEAGIPLWAARA
ncbi:MAG TPA: class I SAM-dependent DNA methyltransferase [Pseudomonadota bacterium]|nr:class I SAM-dependent DNA methyltransferase [Pseudomonadota bacterium]